MLEIRLLEIRIRNKNHKLWLSQFNSVYQTNWKLEMPFELLKHKNGEILFKSFSFQYDLSLFNIRAITFGCCMRYDEISTKQKKKMNCQLTYCGGVNLFCYHPYFAKWLILIIITSAIAKELMLHFENWKIILECRI